MNNINNMYISRHGEVIFPNVNNSISMCMASFWVKQEASRTTLDPICQRRTFFWTMVNDGMRKCGFLTCECGRTCAAEKGQTEKEER